MTIGVTFIIVIITTEARISKVIVERDRQLIRRFDFIFTEQFLRTWLNIDIFINFGGAIRN